MKLLCVDTSGPASGAAVISDGKLVAEVTLNCGLNHSQTIMPSVEYVLESAELKPSDIDMFAAVVGPGSFTGVRIGVCAVKGLARAVNKPCIAVDSLEALAANAAPFDGTVAAILDARRQQVYCAAFICGNGNRPERILDDDVIPISEFFDKLPGTGKLYFTGDGIDTYLNAINERFGERAVIAPPHLGVLRAGAAGMLAIGMTDEAMDANDLRPKYLRAPQAERERNARIGTVKTHE